MRHHSVLHRGLVEFFFRRPLVYSRSPNRMSFSESAQVSTASREHRIVDQQPPLRLCIGQLVVTNQIHDVELELLARRIVGAFFCHQELDGPCSPGRGHLGIEVFLPLDLSDFAEKVVTDEERGIGNPKG